ncbi:MAG: hypothetical protein LBB38_02335 [Puniceicoccales bacterium]|nr:hypothetical protein [Puniceicoccales bacterium]
MGTFETFQIGCPDGFFLLGNDGSKHPVTITHSPDGNIKFNPNSGVTIDETFFRQFCHADLKFYVCVAGINGKPMLVYTFPVQLPKFG